MLCAVVTKNSNWEIVSENLVTFKRQDAVKDEKLLIFLGFTEKSEFDFEGLPKIESEGLPKKGEGAWQETGECF